MPSGKRPSIDRRSVEAALNDMLFTRKDDPESRALYRLALIDDFLNQPDLPDSKSARQYALKSILAQIIREQLAALRSNFALKLPQLDDDLADSEQQIRYDGQQSPLLIAWSQLYYRYVRVDLNLSQGEFARLCAVDPRTLRRYQDQALDYMVEHLMEAEWHARAQNRKRLLHQAIPVRDVVPLIGRAGEYQRILDVLRETGGHSIYVTGAAGVGKSALLRSVVRHLIDQEAVDYLIWLSQPQTVDEIRQALQTHLLHQHSQLSLRDVLLTYRVVVVIDDCEAVFDDEHGWRNLLDDLSLAVCFFTSGIFKAFARPLLHVELKALNRKQTRRYVYELMRLHRYDMSNADVNFQTIWQSVGGNPLAIGLALQELHRGKEEFVGQNVLGQLLKSIYESLTPVQQQLWQLLAFAPPEGVSLTSLQALDTALVDATDSLIDRHIVEPSITKPPRYALNRTARLFIQQQYQNDIAVHKQIQRWLPEVIEVVLSQPGKFIALIEGLLTADWLPRQDDWWEALVQVSWQDGLEQGNLVRWRQILQRSIQATPPYDTLHVGYGTCLRRLVDWESAQNWFHRIVQDTGERGDFILQAQALVEWSVILRSRGEYTPALKLLHQAENTAKNYHQAEVLQQIQLEKAQIAIDRQDGQAAWQFLQDLPETPKVLTLRSEAYLLRQEFDLCCQTAQSVLGQLPSDHFVQRAALHTIIGRSYQASDQFQPSAEHFHTALMLYERANVLFAVARAQTNLAAMYIQLKALEEAESLLREAVGIQQQLRDVVGLQVTQSNLNYLRQLRVQ